MDLREFFEGNIEFLDGFFIATVFTKFLDKVHELEDASEGVSDASTAEVADFFSLFIIERDEEVDESSETLRLFDRFIVDRIPHGLVRDFELFLELVVFGEDLVVVAGEFIY